jgi:NitT/TauT family transport system substrate-binding protein
MNEYNLEMMLRRGGLQRDDVEITPLTFPDMAVAFANRSIDASMYNEPWATQQEQQGVIKKVANVDDAAPGMHVSIVVYGESFARNTPAARNYLIGWLRGVRAYWDAYDGRGDFQAVVDALQKYTALKDEALIRKVPPTGMDPAGYLDPERIATIQDWFVERGLVPQRAELDRVYDRSFADYANAVLGPYQPVESPRRPE